MSTGEMIKYALYSILGMFIIYNIFLSDGDSSNTSNTETVTEEIEIPTEGLITVVKEVETDLFKIDDEITIPDTSESLIVANYMDATTDTFTLAEARLVAVNGSGRSRSVVNAASLGFFGYMMLGRSYGRRPSPGAYTNSKTYNRVNNTAGSRLKQTAKRTTRTRTRPAGKSGFGSKSKSRSTRSYGG